MTRRQVPSARVTIGILGLVALLLQVLVVPRTAAGFADAYPDVAHLAPLYTGAIVIAIVGFEVALLAAWQILSAVTAAGAPTGASKRWGNALTVSLLLAALLLAGVFAHAVFIANVGGPPALFGLLFFLALAAAVVSLRRRVVDFSLEEVHERVLAEG